MHLISPLISGVRNADNGAARIVRRGTSTRATLYSSFEGDAFPSSSLDNDNDVILDSYGRAEVYVNEVCDVTVYDEDGNQQIVFTAGYAASAIEVRSASFTGSEYDGSGTGTSEPVNLQAVLDLWTTAQGAVDWEMAATDQPLIVVTNAPYSATGDSVTDDTVAIQAALADAALSSQPVYFPAGTYRVTSTLTMSPDVAIIGAGAVIQMAHATNALIAVGAGQIVNLALTTTGTGTLVASTGPTRLSNCVLEGKGKLITSSGVLRLTDSSLSAGNYNDGEELIELTAANAEVHASGCTLTASGGAYTPASSAMVYGNNMYFEDCSFAATGATSGTFSYIRYNATDAKGAVARCRFTATGGATLTSSIYLGAYSSGARFYEDNNDLPTSSPFYTYTASDSSSGVHLGTRDKIIKYITDNTGTIAVPTDQFGVVIVSSTHAAPVMTGTLPPYGARGSVIFYHPSGGAGTAQPTTNFFGSTAATTANTSSHIWEYVCAAPNSDLRMLCFVDGKALGNGAP